jgi:hypothetical protein
MTKIALPGPVERARAAWGPDIPGWVLSLAQECAASSQNKAAIKMGWSGAAISQVLKRQYTGDLGAVEDSFQGAFQGAVVDCPAQGAMPTHECRSWRERSRQPSSHNPQRVKMFRACSRCARNQREAAE